jgi:hypothetical protein
VSEIWNPKSAFPGFLDLTPNLALVCAEEADEEGNLYTGPDTEDTPVIAEAVAFCGQLDIGMVEPSPSLEIHFVCGQFPSGPYARNCKAPHQHIPSSVNLTALV